MQYDLENGTIVLLYNEPVRNIWGKSVQQMQSLEKGRQTTKKILQAQIKCSINKNFLLTSNSKMRFYEL